MSVLLRCYPKDKSYCTNPLSMVNDMYITSGGGVSGTSSTLHKIHVHELLPLAVFIVCFDHWGSQQRFFERAEAKGMTTSDYVYLFYSIRGAINQRIWEPWAYERSLTMAQKSRASRPYFNYKQVTSL